MNKVNENDINKNDVNKNEEDLNQNSTNEIDTNKTDIITTNDNETDVVQVNTCEENSNKKESVSNRIKTSFSSKKFKGGAYTTIITTIVIVIVLFVNIITSELGFKVDLSETSLYTLTNDTKDYVHALKDDITIYYMTQTGKEDDMVKKIIEKYNALSDNVKVVYKDPILNPSFASQYVEDTVTNNSVIVVNNTNGKAKYVDSSNMYQYEIDYTNYSQKATAVDVEGQVTAALQYVTNEELPIMYTVDGHGETAVSETLTKSLTKINVTSNKLSTLTIKTIPKDCSILLINAPHTDYSTEEVSMIEEYLKAGGKAIIYVDYVAEGLTNFNKLLNYYGVGLVKGIVLENDKDHIMGQYANNLVPDISTHDITTPLQDKGVYVAAPAATGIKVLEDARSTIEAKPLLTTSDKSFSKINMNSTSATKEDGDIAGPFNLGVAISESYNGVDTKLVVYGTPYLIDESMLSYPSLGNLDLFLNSVKYTTDKESVIAIQSKSFVPGSLTLTAAQATLWATLTVIIIPLFLLIIGGFVTIRRRKK